MPPARNASCSAAADARRRRDSRAATAGRRTAARSSRDTAERDVRVETRDVIAVFTNRGARLKSWRLKHYLDQQKQPQELVESDLPSQPLPFTLRDGATSGRRDAERRALHGQRRADRTPLTSPIDLRFEYRDSAGVSRGQGIPPRAGVVSRRPFRHDVTAGRHGRCRRRSCGARRSATSARSAATSRRPKGSLFQRRQGRAARGEGHRQAADATTATSDYAGVDDNYFMAAALVPGPEQGHVPAGLDSAAGRLEGGGARAGRRSRSSRQPRDAPLKFFAGPEGLRRAQRRSTATWRAAIDFGMFAVIVVPLLRSLKWVNGYVGNYGWSIIILTIIINVIMFPLRHKSVVSMRKMQEIQPEVKAIQDRYAKLKATDPAKQKMNQEMMALYKERGVNPASGCVPMLLTMPVLFAFYALLSTAIELRGAPFFGWIHDLSAHDPYYVTPVLMGVSQIGSSVTPAAGVDPAQQKMMMFMPVVFTFMFLWVPAGVALYWLDQQRLGDRPAVPDELHDRPAEDPSRRRPAAGGGAAREAGRRRQDRRGGARQRVSPSDDAYDRHDAADRRVSEPRHRPRSASRDRRRRGDRRRPAPQPRRATKPSCSCAIAASRSRRCSTSSTSAYGRSLTDEKRVFVDALEYRKGKDIELRQMAKFLAEKAKQTGLDQQLGPLNPYERRIVHLAVAEVPGVTTESVGDAFSKTVLISLRK